MTRPCSRLSIVAAVVILGGWLASPADAVLLIQAQSPSSTSGFAVAGVQYVSQPFSLQQDVANAQFILGVRDAGTTPVHGVISTSIGPGTTQDDVLVEFDIPTVPARNVTPTTVLELDAIAAGSYFLTLGTETSISQSIIGDQFQYGRVTSNDFGSIGDVWTASIFDLNNQQAEASNFSPGGGGLVSLNLAIHGDITSTPPGIPGGNETFFDFDPPAIDGVGVTIADLGAEHGHDSQSVGGSDNTTTSTLLRTFGFDSTDTEADSVEVFIHAILEGRLIVDNFSQASVMGLLEIRDADGALLSTDDAFVSVSALGGELVEADVFEVLTISALLVPGEDYSIFSSLTLMTDAGLFGAARALFADTFIYEISTESDNPFGEPGSQTETSTREQPPRDPEADPDPPALRSLAPPRASQPRNRRRGA